MFAFLFLFLFCNLQVFFNLLEVTDQKFVLERELQLIECGLYYKLLKDAGYADEVMNLLLL